MRLRTRLATALLVAGLCGVVAAGAGADPFVGPPICGHAGTAVWGAHGPMTISGNAYVPEGKTFTVTGNLTLAPGSCLDAFIVATVHVSGDILVGHGAVLALGCSPGSLGPPLNQPPCHGVTTTDTVGGSINAQGALTMYLDGDTIHGSVISTGGGPGPTFNPYNNFTIKDNSIGGNVSVSGWQGAWFGLIRNHIGGSVSLTNNVGVAIGDLGTPDSNEVATNVIAGNLTCTGNNPAAQLGDSGGATNTVGGSKLGQCAGL